MLLLSTSSHRDSCYTFVAIVRRLIRLSGALRASDTTKPSTYARDALRARVQHTRQFEPMTWSSTYH